MVILEWQEHMVSLDKDWDLRVTLYVPKEGGEHMKINLHIVMLV